MRYLQILGPKTHILGGGVYCRPAKKVQIFSFAMNLNTFTGFTGLMKSIDIQRLIFNYQNDWKCDSETCLQNRLQFIQNIDQFKILISLLLFDKNDFFASTEFESFPKLLLLECQRLKV